MNSKSSTSFVRGLLITALLSASSAADAQPLTNNLTFYAPFSSSLNDVQGGRIATVGGSAARQTSGGIAGGYLQLQNGSGGKAKQWVYYSDPTPATDDFSVQIWVRSTDPQNGQAQPDMPMIANKDWNTGANVGWVLAREDGTDGDKFQWNMNTPGGSRIDLDPYGNTNATVFDGTWHQLLISYQRAGYATFYQDGVFVLFADISAQNGQSLRPTPDGTWITNNIMALGQDATLRYWMEGGDTRPSSYNGDLDEVAMWGRALNPSEAFTAYAKGTNGLALSGTLAPRFVRQPQGGTRYAGDTFRLFSIVAGDPVTFQWYKDSALVTGATNTDVLLTNLSTNSAGNYRLVVNSSSGSITSSPAILAVLPGGNITNGLAVYLNLDDNISGQAGTAVNGTAVGGSGSPPVPKYTTGRIGNAAVFDNNGDPGWLPFTPTDWGISLGDLETIYSNSFSFSLWINEANNNNNLALFGNKDWTVGGNIGWVVAPHNNVVLNYYAAGGPRRDLGGVNILDSQWHHVAEDFDRDANTVYVYVDGNRVSLASLSATGWESFAPTNFGYHSTLIGGSGNGAYSGAGAVDDVGIWSRMLSANEILSIYSQGVANQPLTTASGAAGIPPSLSSQPQSLTLFEGRKARFAVTAAGSAPLSYQWFKNGNAISNATNTTLLFYPVSTNNQGSYTVVVTNKFGSITNDPAAVLTVLPITNITSGLAVYLNFDNNIDAQAGTIYNGTPIGANPAPKYTSGRIGNSAIFNNDGGAGISSDWAVSLGNIEWIYTNSWSFSLWVNATNANDGALLGNKDWYSGGNVGWVFDPTRVDSLNYTCDGANRYDIGTVSTLDGNWHNVVAVFDRDLNQVSYYVDGNLTASNNVGNTGYESLTPTGFPNDTLVGSSGNDTWSGAGAIDDLGIWYRPLSAQEVLAVYIAGANNQPLTAAVPGATKPLITGQPQGATVPEGFPFSFRVAATGSTPLGYQWRKNGVNLAGATSSTFAIPALISADAASYSVVVSNFVGMITSTPPALLTVVTNPASPITNGLVVYLDFESNILAQAGTTVNGTAIGVNGVEKYDSGIVGLSSARFDNDDAAQYRASDWAVSLGDIEWIYTNNWTFSLWVKTADTTGALLGNKDWSSGANIGWLISEFYTDWLNYRTDGGARHDIGNYNWANQSWHHVGAVFYRDINTVYTYVDGYLTAQDALGVSGTESLTDPYITTTLVGSSGNAIYSASGNVDDLAMWTRPLTQAEFVGIYQAGLQGHGIPQAASGAPSLAALASSGNLLLVYPDWARAYTLESSPGLAPAAWTKVSAVPAFVGGNSVVSLPVTPQAQFFRLRH